MSVHGYHQSQIAKAHRQLAIRRYRPEVYNKPRRVFGYTAMGWLIIFNLTLMSALLGASAGAVMIVLEK